MQTSSKQVDISKEHSPFLQTFMSVPYRSDATGSLAAILGCPFDCGIHPFRIGARQGPNAIRQQSGLIRRFDPEGSDIDILNALNVVDCGDVALVPSRIEEGFARIESAALDIARKGTVPLGLGGDGSVSLPLIRAASQLHPELVVLHIDSHTDAYPADDDYPYDASTQFTHAALEKRIAPNHSCHVGLRGTTMRQGVHDYGHQLGYQLITMSSIERRGMQSTVEDIHNIVGHRPVYLSWDMDVFDPSCAPGVCTPIWGGFSAREGLGLLRGLKALDIVAADVNTVSPPHDVKGSTAFLAAMVCFEILTLIHART